MAPLVVTAAERPDLDAPADEVWPEYNRHGDVLNWYWGRLDERFADFQFVLLDEDSGAVLAQGHSAPLSWEPNIWVWRDLG